MRLQLPFFLLLFTIASCKKESPDPCEGSQLPTLGTCIAVAPHAGLSFNDSTGVYTYRTKGGGIIIFDTTTIRIKHEDYPNFTYMLWGDYMEDGNVMPCFCRESLNGKHIKNKISKTRTIIFPDGAKLTMVAENEEMRVLTVSIYEGAHSYRFNTGLSCNRTLELSSAEICIRQALDQAEADGETASFEINSTGLTLFNLYTEDTPGNKVGNRYDLGGLELAEPNKVNDYYNDPRLGHT